MNKTFALLSWIAPGLIALASATGAHAAGDPERGQTKASMCAGCHQIAGWRNAYPAYRAPKLGGQHPEYLVSALKAYKAKERWHPTMQSIAATLTDRDMADLAAYYAGAVAQGEKQK